MGFLQEGGLSKLILCAHPWHKADLDSVSPETRPAQQLCLPVLAAAPSNCRVLCSRHLPAHCCLLVSGWHGPVAVWVDALPC